MESVESVESMESTATELQKRKREEYEMQVFGFHSRAVYATLKNIVVERIQSRSNKLCESLKMIYKVDSKDLTVLKKNEEHLVKAYYNASLPHLKNIESIVNKLIAVPNNVLANTDKLQETQYTEAGLESMRTKLNELQLRAKQATILNAALKEELKLIEQFSTCTDDTNRLSHIIENGVACLDISNNIHQLVSNYKQLNSCLENGTPESQKLIYNTIDGLKCKEIDIDNLT